MDATKERVVWTPIFRNLISFDHSSGLPPVYFV